MSDAPQFERGPMIYADELLPELADQIFGKPIMDMLRAAKQESKPASGAWQVMAVDRERGSITVTFVEK